MIEAALMIVVLIVLLTLVLTPIVYQIRKPRFRVVAVKKEDRVKITIRRKAGYRFPSEAKRYDLDGYRSDNDPYINVANVRPGQDEELAEGIVKAKGLAEKWSTKEPSELDAFHEMAKRLVK